MRRSGGAAPGTTAACGAPRPMPSQPASLAALRKQRAKQQAPEQPTRAFLLCAAAGMSIAALGLMLLYIQKGTRNEARPEEHAHYREALRVLGNDGLEPTDDNVRFALRLIDAATKPYSSHDFQTIDPSGWSPASTSVVRDVEADGHNLTLLPVETGRAKVWLVKDFVSQEEASELLTMGSKADFGTSLTKHSDGQEWRSSSSAVLKRGNVLIDRLRQRAAMVCRVRPSFVEDLQIVRYRPGEQYQPHMDSDGPHHRHWTLLLYLNDPGGGGATGFPLLHLRVMPAPRAAVLWENLRSEPGIALPVRNYYTLHDGQAPTGHHPKFAVNIWIRSSEYRPGMP